MPKISDKEFLEKVKQYQNLVFSICLSYAKNVFDAEDLAQETFMAAYKKLHTFDGQNFKAWIAMIAANKCRDFLRISKQNENIENYDIADEENAVEKTVIRRQEKTEIYKLCCRLKEPYKTVAVKYFVEDIKLSEYACVSGEKLKTLQTRLYRAKQQLKLIWKEESKRE